MVCGGMKSWRPNVTIEVRNDCYEPGVPDNGTVLMLEGRYYAAAEGIGNSLWVSGGVNQAGQELKSSEFVTFGEGSRPGPDLPYTMSHHCLMRVNKFLSFFYLV